jgi:hypothetical protein
MMMMMMIVQPERPQITIWRMCIACWVPKSKKTHSQHLLLLHCKNGCKNALRCYVKPTLLVLFHTVPSSTPVHLKVRYSFQVFRTSAFATLIPSNVCYLPHLSCVS